MTDSSHDPPVASSTQSPDRLAWIDLLRVIAAFLVVLDHCTVIPPHANVEGSANVWFEPLLKVIAKPAVPIFVMISGALLIRPSLDLGVFLRRRLLRLLPPFFFGSAIYLIYRIVVFENTISLLSCLRLIWTGEAYFHLWFFYVLFGVYLAIPFLSLCWRQQASERYPLIIFFLAIWLAFYSLFPTLAAMLESATEYSFNSGLSPYVGFFGGFVGYAMMGKYLADRPINTSLAIGMLLAGISLTTTAVLLADRYQIASIAARGNSPLRILIIVGIYAIAQQITFRHAWLSKISSWTLGIYLLHPLIIDVSQRLLGLKLSGVGVIVTALCVFSLSACIVLIISQSRLLRRVMV